ncbi:MAG: GAK system CofD-like protein [Desulfonatronovibrionaceae bacterium]
MNRIRLSRSVTLPDRLKLARYLKAPELGPKILFFSGGTALNTLSRNLVDYTHNSIHVVTPFDSGGSSAKLRQAFDMLAVGDLRSRLMALADQTVKGNPAIFRLFSHRLPKDKDRNFLEPELESMARGRHALVSDIPDPMRKIIRNHLTHFIKKMPDDFELQGASIGNLILAAGYFINDRHIDPVIFIFSRLVEVRGTVRPVMNRLLHLIARLQDGSLVQGQHMLTGKETSPISSPVQDIFLSSSLDSPEPYRARIRDKMRNLINEAELICYPMGSFYSSIIANILPLGVGSAIAENLCPKIYIPNTGNDPEQFGTSLAQRVEILVDQLSRSCFQPCPDSALLDLVLIDKDHSLYQGGVDIKRIESLGIKVLEARLALEKDKPRLDCTLLVETLLSMV